MDYFLEIGSGVAGAPCSRHAVDKRGLMGMVVEITGIAEVIGIIPLVDGSVDEVIDHVLGHTRGKAYFHKCLSFLHILVILLGGVSGLVWADGVFAPCRMAVAILYSERTLVLTTSADALTVEEEGCVIGF